MSRRLALVLTAALSVAAIASAPASAQPAQGETITATGTGQARVSPSDPHSNSSIAAAVDAARQASIGGAVSQAHEYALEYAQAVGLTLGSVISVSDAQNGFYGPGAALGPFGPGQYCGKVRRIVGRPVKGKKPKFKTVYRCLVPRFAFTTLTITYSAS